VIAAIGPKNVAMTAEIAEGWEPAFFLPERAGEVWGESLAAGKAKRDPSLGELDVIAAAALAIGEDAGNLIEFVRPMLALYIGGMGAKGCNFYNDLACRYGYAAEAGTIQDLYLAGKKEQAIAAVPRELAEKVSLIGPEGYVRERLAAMKQAGVTTLNVQPLAVTHEERVALIERVRKLAAEV
jgi:F420-dependent oxidoreductase-like protein